MRWICDRWEQAVLGEERGKAIGIVTRLDVIEKSEEDLENTIRTAKRGL